MTIDAELIPFAAFADMLPGISRRVIERASNRGDFPPGVRLTPKAPMLFRREAVMAWLADRLAPLEAAR